MSINRLIWERDGDSFDLKVTNETIDVEYLRGLLEKVINSDPARKDNLAFNAEAVTAFGHWFKNYKKALPKKAYGLLSNWFLTSLKYIRESDRGKAALEFWQAIFCAVPRQRLTDPDRDYIILEGPFNVWWAEQQKCQKQRG